MKDDPTNNENPSEAEKVLLAVESSAHSAVATALHHKKGIAIATAAVIVISLGYALVSHFQAKAETAAWNGIFKAEFTARQQSKATSLDEQLKAAEGATAHANARFYAYMLEIAQHGAGKDKAEWEKAAAAAAKFVKEFPHNPFINQVRLDYGAILTNLGDYAKAEEQYDKVVKSGNPEEQASARLFAALAQERAGRLDQARDSYNRLAATGSGFAEVAVFARTRLEQRTAAPAAPATPAASAPAAQPAAPAPVEQPAAPAPAPAAQPAPATPAAQPAAPAPAPAPAAPAPEAPAAK